MGDFIALGIDPGASGGLAAIFPDGSVDITPMPDTVQDVWEWVERYTGLSEHPCHEFAYLEKVGGFMGDGKAGTPNKASGHTMFRFGQSYGNLQMALTAASIPYEEIPPKRWQKAIGISPRAKGESKTEWKRRLKDNAQKMFPRVKVTLATADALLLAEVCRRSRLGKTLMDVL